MVSFSNLSSHVIEEASLHLNNKGNECHTSRLPITSTIKISFTTIAPHSICFWVTLLASAFCFSALLLFIVDIRQMLCIKVSKLAHLLTSITEATLCTMPCLLLECRLIVPFLISAQPKVGLSSLDTQVSAQKNSIFIRFLPISSIHCILSFSKIC